MSVSKAVRLLRSELGMTQMELAVALHMSFTTVNRWENGRMRPTKKAMKSLLELAESGKIPGHCVDYLKNTMEMTRQEMRDALVEITSVDPIVADQLLELSPNAVSVCDCETNEILYLNPASGRFAGKDVRDAIGKRCYEYWFDRTKPCEFCNREAIVEDGFTVSEVEYPSLKKRYRVSSKKVCWKGRDAHIDYVTDLASE